MRFQKVTFVTLILRSFKLGEDGSSLRMLSMMRSSVSRHDFLIVAEEVEGEVRDAPSLVRAAEKEDELLSGMIQTTIDIYIYL